MWSKNSTNFCFGLFLCSYIVLCVFVVSSFVMCVKTLHISDRSLCFCFHYSMVLGLFLIYQFDHISIDTKVPFFHILGVCLLFVGFVSFINLFFKYCRKFLFMQSFINVEKYIFEINIATVVIFFVSFIFSFSSVFVKVAIAVEYVLCFVVLIQLYLLNRSYYKILQGG